MRTQEHTAAAAASVAAGRWGAQFDQLMTRIGPRFCRVETRRRAGKLVLGLLAELPRTNSWTVAEYVGDASPDGLQHLLSRAVWDEDGVRDDLRGYVVEQLGDDDVVLVLDETGDLKKGTHTVGVSRLYTGTAGRIENAQVAVYLAYATSGGHAFVDRELYLPKSWTDDGDRCKRAAVPAEVAFATKPQLGKQMLARVLGDANLKLTDPFVAGDEVYGDDPGLRAALEEQKVGYVLAVSKSHQVRTPGGKHRVDQIAEMLCVGAWQQRSAGQGAKGPRLYDWALVEIHPDKDGELNAGHRWLLIRRNLKTRELAYFRCSSPKLVGLARLVTVAGRRWRVEEAIQAGKGLAGLDEHQVRRWTSWRRWTILSMLAHAFLAVTKIAESRQSTSDNGLIQLTCNEIRHLFTTLVSHPVRSLLHRAHWSIWRRRHQYRAKISHYKRRGATP